MKILWRLIITFVVTLLLPFVVIGTGVGILTLIAFYPTIIILITFIILFLMIYNIISEL